MGDVCKDCIVQRAPHTAWQCAPLTAERGHVTHMAADGMGQGMTMLNRRLLGQAPEDSSLCCVLVMLSVNLCMDW